MDGYDELLGVPNFPDFDYKKHKKGDGFALKVKK